MVKMWKAKREYNKRLQFFKDHVSNSVTERQSGTLLGIRLHPALFLTDWTVSVCVCVCVYVGKRYSKDSGFSKSQ